MDNGQHEAAALYWMEDVGIAAEASISEVGAGANRLAIAFAKLGFRVTATDAIAEMADRAAQLAVALHLDGSLETAIADVHELPYTDQSYDVGDTGRDPLAPHPRSSDLRSGSSAPSGWHLGCDIRRPFSLALISAELDVAGIGSGSRGEFREEDQICRARIGEPLVATGYVAGVGSAEITARWISIKPAATADGNTVAYLRRSDQTA